MADDLYFVQFPHPGREHGESAPGHKGWNIGSHGRKFLLSQGLARGRVDRADERAELVFWGEWEPPSWVDRIAEPVKDGPRWLHRPYQIALQSARGYANTDPYVFGDRFLYSNCRQGSPGARTRFLAPGTVILFGSSLHGAFVLDTVFVVSRGTDYKAAEARKSLAGCTDESFRAVTLDSIAANLPGCNFRLYEGATPSTAVDGMFSFAPCRLLREAPQGFSRPIISIPEVNGALARNYQCRQITRGQARQLWGTVVNQVIDEGLMLATQLATPPADAGEAPELAGSAGCAPSCTARSRSGC